MTLHVESVIPSIVKLEYNTYPHSLYYLHAAPSAAPTSFVITDDITATTITVQWGPVNCSEQNGVITGYIVQYGVVDSGNIQTTSVSGDNATISSLVPSTNYSIQVAAETGVGPGPYTDPLTARTDGMY